MSARMSFFILMVASFRSASSFSLPPTTFPIILAFHSYFFLPPSLCLSSQGFSLVPPSRLFVYLSFFPFHSCLPTPSHSLLQGIPVLLLFTAATSWSLFRVSVRRPLFFIVCSARFLPLLLVLLVPLGSTAFFYLGANVLIGFGLPSRLAPNLRPLSCIFSSDGSFCSARST